MRWIRSAAGVAVLAFTATACTAAPTAAPVTTGRLGPAAVTTTSVPASTPAPPTTRPKAPSAPATSAASGTPVHVSLLEGDGQTYGIGMPVIAYFDRAPTDHSTFQAAVTTTVNGRVVNGAWYWQKSGRAGAAVEAHYRLAEYWPAHSVVRMNLPLGGLSAGQGLVYGNSLTLSITIGAAHIGVVDGRTEHLTVTSDGRQVFDVPVSLGAATTPTFGGVKVVMEKDRVQEMRSNPGEAYYDLMVPWSVRLTNSGEFIHSASWNGGNIGIRSTSHGCTNLTVDDAHRYFDFAELGDVFTYRNTGGPTMPVWDGYGDWNVPWTQWQAGGLPA